MRARPPALTAHATDHVLDSFSDGTWRAVSGRISRPVRRRAVLLAALLAASCASETPPVAPGAGNFPPLDFSYLLPLRLNVATVEIMQLFVPSGQPPDVTPLDPVQPVAALRLMAQQRLRAEGATGRAVFVINDASLIRQGELITGTMSVELDIFTSGTTRAGYAQATVVRQLTGPVGDLSMALYQFTREMMDQMNVEFEYQVRHALADWLLPAGAVPSPVQAAPLPPQPPDALAPPPAPLAPPAGPPLDSSAIPPPGPAFAPPPGSLVAPGGALGAAPGLPPPLPMQPPPLGD